MNEYATLRTLLFVPGNRPERVEKAVNAGADAVIIDLEDAVPLALKEETRPLVREKVRQHGNVNIIVRVNALESGFLKGDLDEIVIKELRCIIVPKVESPSNLREINSLLLEAEMRKGLEAGAISVIPLIESAKAVQEIYEIVSEKTSPERLFTVAFGAADYTLDMGIEMTREGNELFYPRSRIAVACKAARVEPPLDTPFMIDVKDAEGLKIDALRAKTLGFQGKLCVHPTQVVLCNEIFSPTADEVQYARQVVIAFEDAEASGMAAIQLNGKMIDYPVVERSKRILRLAERIGGLAK
ncbi:MAG: CoA ester lyase [Deltaproteobacteria bacterium]|nr:CoA ester lyase [Deltaproteobacteria bacterium]